MIKTNGIESNMNDSKASISTTSSTAKTKQMLVFNSLRNLNDVFEFAKNDLNSKYLSDNICRNFSSKQKRIKLKELMDEVVIMQQESGHLSNSNQTDCYHEKSQSQKDDPLSSRNSSIQFINKDPQVSSKKTLMDLLTSPSSMQQNYILPSFKSMAYLENSNAKHERSALNKIQLDTDEPNFSQLSESCTRTYTFPINGLLQLNNTKIYNDNSTAKKLNDIIDLIKINNQFEETSLNSIKIPHTRPILNFKLNPKDSTKINDCPNQKLFMTKLDEKEQALSNKINRNMEFLQNCLKANLMNENSAQKFLRLNNAHLSSVNLTDSNASNESTSSNDTSTEVKTRKKLNFYSIGNFISSSKKIDESSFSSEDVEIISKNQSAKQPNKVTIAESNHCSSNRVKSKGKGKYTCGACGFKNKKPSILRIHMKRHENFRPFICSWCEISFKTKGNLQKHMKTQSHIKKCLELGI